MSALEPLLAKVIAERDMHREMHRRLLSTVRAKSETCGYCARPLIEPGECGIPGVHLPALDLVEEATG